MQVDSALKRATAIAQQCMDEVSRLRDENSQQAHVFDEQLKAKEAVHVLRARALTAECASLEQELVQIREHSKQISNEEQRRHLAALDRQREKLGQAPMLQRQEYERTLSRVRDECSNRVVRLEAERATEVASLKEYAHRSTAQLRAEASNLQLWLVKERREWATAEKQIRDRHNSRMDGLREIHEGQRAMLVKEYEVQLSTFGCSLSQIEAETNLRMANQAASHRATLATLKARLASEDAARCTAMRVSLSEMQTELDHCVDTRAFEKRRLAQHLHSQRDAVCAHRRAAQALREEAAKAFESALAECAAAISALRAKAEADTVAATRRHEGVLQATREQHAAELAERDMTIVSLRDDSSSSVARLMKKGEDMQLDFESKHAAMEAQHAAALHEMCDDHANVVAEYEAMLVQLKAEGERDLVALQELREGDLARVTAAAQKEYEELKCEVEDLRYEQEQERGERAQERVERDEDEQSLRDAHEVAASAMRADLEEKMREQAELRAAAAAAAQAALEKQAGEAEERHTGQAAAHADAMDVLAEKLAREDDATVMALHASLEYFEAELYGARQRAAATRVQAQERARAYASQMAMLKREGNARAITLVKSMRSAEKEAAAHRAEGAGERGRLCAEHAGQLQAAADVLARSKTILYEDRAKQKAALTERDELINVLRSPLIELLPPVPTHGTMRVHLTHASGLRAGDLSGLSDPYMVISYAGHKEKSAVVLQTLNPTFDWHFIFDFSSVSEAYGETIFIEAWDQDTIKYSDKIGHGSLEFGEHANALESGQCVECVAALEFKPVVGKAVTAGQAFFKLTWEPEPDRYAVVRRVLETKKMSAVEHTAVDF